MINLIKSWSLISLRFKRIYSVVKLHKSKDPIFRATIKEFLRFCKDKSRLTNLESLVRLLE
jgi:hypothetical protein